MGLQVLILKKIFYNIVRVINCIVLFYSCFSFIWKDNVNIILFYAVSETKTYIFFLLWVLRTVYYSIECTFPFAFAFNILYNDLPFMNLGSVHADMVWFCQVFGKQWYSKVNCFWHGKTMFEHCLSVAWRIHSDLVNGQRSSICILAA